MTKDRNTGYHVEIDDEEAPPPPPSHPHPDDIKAATREADRNDKDLDDGDEPEDEQSVEIPPTPIVHRMKEAEENAKVTRSPNKLFIGLIALLVAIIAIVLGAGFGTGAFQTSSSSGAAPTDPTTPSTTNPSPTSDPAPSPIANVSEAQGFTEYLSTVSANGAQSFEDPNSAEYRAALWLAKDDPLQLDPTDTKAQPRINQRYALAALYFSSDTSNQDSNWLSEDECTWQGVSCLDSRSQRRRRLDETQETTAPVAATSGLTTTKPTSAPQRSSAPASSPVSASSTWFPVVEIDLFDRNYAGTLSPDITLLTSLTSLDLSLNDIEGDFSQIGWGKLKNLTILDVSSNFFTGSLGTSLFELTSLKRLTLGDNLQLAGTLASSISNLKNLEVWNMENTGIGGAIPSEIGLLQKMTIFNINFSLFNGTIPSEIGNLQTLFSFTAQENRFVGSIPSEVGTMQSLVEFSCRANILSGSVEGIFGGLPNIRKGSFMGTVYLLADHPM